jgi:putative ABC transport system permease protein
VIVLRSIRYRVELYLGAFIALCLATALAGLTLIALDATGDAPAGGGPTLTVNGHAIARDAVDLGGLRTVLALAGIVSTFVGVLVVAGTFAFGVALRRRDLALLRLVAATGGQVRRMILVEAAVVAVPAGLIGCTLAWVIAPAALKTLTDIGLSPAPLVPPPGPGLLPFAFVAGLVVALLGAEASGRRAARIRPVEALRDADLDVRVMTAGRWLLGVPLLAGSVVMLRVASGADAETATPLVVFGGLALTAAAAALGPVYLAPLGRMLLVPLAGTAAGRVAAASVGTGRRRTAALVTPVLAVVAVTGLLGGVLAATDAAVEADRQAHVLAELEIVGADPAALDAARATPGVRALSAVGSLPVVVIRATGPDRQDAAVADLQHLADTTTVRALAGSLDPLGPHDAAVSAEYAGWFGYHVGGPLTVALFDGRTLTLTITAILDAGAATPTVVLSPATAASSSADALVRVAAGVDPAVVAGRLRAAGLRVDPATGRPSDEAEKNRLDTAVLTIITGPTTGYALIAFGTALVMAATARRRELSTFRLLGAGRHGVRRLLLLESAAAVTLGVLLGSAIVGAALTAHHAALLQAYTAAPVALPRPTLVALVGGCAFAATMMSLLTATAVTTRKRAD